MPPKPERSPKPSKTNTTAKPARAAAAASTATAAAALDPRAPAAPPAPAAIVEAMHAAPDDKAGYRAYAAYLREHGDPQAEVIELALAADDEPKQQRSLKVKAAAAMKAFLEARVLPAYGAIADRFVAAKKGEAPAIEWRWGMIDRFDTFFWPKTAEATAAVERLLRSELVRFARRVWWRDYPDLVDVGPVARMGGVRVLGLSANGRLVDVEAVRGLRHLWKLELKRTAVEDLAPLAGCEALQYVNVDGKQVASLRPLHGLPRLWEVWCRDARVSAEEAAALRAAMAERPLPERPEGGMDRRDVYGP